MKVGFIGLGRMGMPMAHRLLQSGLDLTVHNRSRGNVDHLARHGAHPAFSPAEISRTSDVVLTCLPDVQSVETVFLGPAGVLSAARPGQVLVDHSTVGLSTSRWVAEAAREAGASFLDAPISGGVERAADGTLTIMVGGEQEAFESVKPALEVMGATVRHVGPTGAGTAVKLVNQLLCAIHSEAAAEAMLLGIRAGADPRMLLEILTTSWGQSFMLSRNAPVMIDRGFENARAPLKTYVKDVRLVRELAEEVGSPAPVADLTTRMFEEALDSGMGELDVSCLLLPLEERVAGEPVAGPPKEGASTADG